MVTLELIERNTNYKKEQGLKVNTCFLPKWKKFNILQSLVDLMPFKKQNKQKNAIDTSKYSFKSLIFISSQTNYKWNP